MTRTRRETIKGALAHDVGGGSDGSDFLCVVCFSVDDDDNDSLRYESAWLPIGLAKGGSGRWRPASLASLGSTEFEGPKEVLFWNSISLKRTDS